MKYQNCKYYTKSWDVKEPPKSPPTRTISTGGYETKISKQKTMEWLFRMKEWKQNRDIYEEPVESRFDILDL